MPLEGNTNHFGTQYAGAIFSLAEFPFGLMFAARFGLKEMLPVIGEMQIRYLMPSPLPLEVELRVEESEWCQLEKETREKGRARLVRDIDVVDADGRVHARATATYFSLLRESRG
jgi:acyl-coenzyme A thioesterase PaaI-like protein